MQEERGSEFTRVTGTLILGSMYYSISNTLDALQKEDSVPPKHSFMKRLFHEKALS